MTILKLVLIGGWFMAGVILFFESIFGVKTTTPKAAIPMPVNPAPSNRAVSTPDKDDEGDDDDNALESVQIFKTKIKARASFYESLSGEVKAEFRRYFIDNGKEHLAPDLHYSIGSNNDEFFSKVFNFIFRYRRLISLSLLKKLTDELVYLAEDNPETLTIIYEAATRVAYARRKVPEFFRLAESWAALDVALHQTKLQTQGKYVYAFSRLAIIFEKNKQYSKALAITEDALKRKLLDKTKTGFEGRKERLLRKIGH